MNHSEQPRRTTTPDIIGLNARHTIECQITNLLANMNALGGYPMSLVCTDQGLLLASAGSLLHSEVTAGLTSLFAYIMTRATRDLDVLQVSELTLSDTTVERMVIRPLTRGADQVRLFLVIQVPHDGTWRRNTNLVARKLLPILRPWLTSSETVP